MARKGRTKVIYKGTFVSIQSLVYRYLYVFMSNMKNRKYGGKDVGFNIYKPGM